jgi:hypothetical protein
MVWPVRVVSDLGDEWGLARVLGDGGDRVEHLLSGLVSPRPRPDATTIDKLVRDTPGGRVDVPVVVVPLGAAADLAARVQADWVDAVDLRRSAPRRALVEAGREPQLEAALHTAMLLAVDRLPASVDGTDVRAASGLQLWVLGGMVTAALAPVGPDPFAPWAELLGYGLWPIGPSAGRLVVADPSLPPTVLEARSR